MKAIEIVDGKAVLNDAEIPTIGPNEILIKVPWSELKTYSKWTSGWLQLPKDEDCDGN